MFLLESARTTGAMAATAVVSYDRPSETAAGTLRVCKEKLTLRIAIMCTSSLCMGLFAAVAADMC
jgi:hypothetical protein